MVLRLVNMVFEIFMFANAPAAKIIHCQNPTQTPYKCLGREFHWVMCHKDTHFLVKIKLDLTENFGVIVCDPPDSVM